VDKEYVNENYGKLEKVTDSGKPIIEASGVEDALEELAMEDYDKHPEKRMRQAWQLYFEKQLPLFKIAYPNLKRSQYINLISKEFKTSPENPVFVQNQKKK
jgi:hypothetical protein